MAPCAKGDSVPPPTWLPCAKGAVSQRLTEGLSARFPNLLSPPSRSARHLPSHLRFVKFFRGKNLTRVCGRIQRRDNRVRAERCSAKSRFSLPLCPIRGKVPFLSGSCSAFRMGKKSITSDALFADLLLSPPSLRDTSPYHKGRQSVGWFGTPFHKGRYGEGRRTTSPLSERGGERREAQRSLAIGKGKRSSPAFLPEEGKEAGEKGKNASPTKYCTVYTRFPQINRKKLPSKRGEGVQIAPESGRFTAATLLKCKRARGIPVKAQDAPLYRVSLNKPIRTKR